MLTAPKGYVLLTLVYSSFSLDRFRTQNRIAYPVAPLYDIAVNPDPAARFRMATCGASSTVALVGDPMLPPSTTIQVV